MINTIKRKANKIPQRAEDPPRPRDQNPETEDIEDGPSSFKPERIRTIKKNLAIRKNSPEE